MDGVSLGCVVGSDEELGKLLGELVGYDGSDESDI